MKSWGRLPGNMVEQWRQRRCDMVFTIQRMGKRPLSTCLTTEFPTSKNHPNLKDNLPLIAIMAATTTRNVKNPSPDSMALFLYMLPSLIRSVDCGYRYEYVLGFDAGDPFYDSTEVIFHHSFKFMKFI